MTTRNPLNEKSLQKTVIEHLVNDNKYIERCAKTDYDPVTAMDKDILFEFLEKSQGDVMDKIREIYDGGYQATVVNRIVNDIAKRGLVKVLWDGVDFDGGIKLDLVEPRPTSAKLDPKAADLYEQNILSVMEEVYHKDDERIDLVIMLNGFAIFTIELKCETSASGWTYRDAIDQYKFERDCTTRLLTPKVGALAHFAMDLDEAWVCAELKGEESNFLPFNMGCRDEGDTHATSSGNPHNDNGINTSYMWEDILTKDSVFDLIYDFIYIAKKRSKTGKTVKEIPIFPRFQQLRAVRRVSDDISKHATARNYLVEHSAGSGKTNTISWLAHKLSSLYQPDSIDPLFDKVIVITDRKVVDRQLQEAITDMAKDSGVVRVMDDKKTSTDLGKALHSNYRIVVSTIQKFLNLPQGTFEDEGKRFAVLIDEAHGSTSGKSMEAVNATLSDGIDIDSSLDDVSKFVAEDIARSGKQPNVSLIGFTATPTGKTLQQFGMFDENGNKVAFDLYSMKQAIEEGFILDVTSNYTTYKTYCKVVKAINDDPKMETKQAKRKLAKMIATSDGTILGNLAVMVDHFTGTVADTLAGKAKAMVVTAGREEAVRYFLAYQQMQNQDMAHLGKHKALVAFTGDITIDSHKYTEAGLNGFSDDKTAELFDTDDYRILIVADKFQTGFDQPKLAAMYVDKKISGITAVQTLSRLNRIYPPFDKRTFVLDFKNDYIDIHNAFAPFYEDTILEDPLTLSDVRETQERLMNTGIIDIDDVEEYNAILSKGKLSSANKERMIALLDRAKQDVKGMDETEAEETRRIIRNFLKQYSFLLQVAPFEDRRMHMLYNFCIALIRMLDASGGTSVIFTIEDKVNLEEFVTEKTGEYNNEELVSGPKIRIAEGTGTGLSEDQMDRLSAIIADWNSRYGTNFSKSAAAGVLVTLTEDLGNDPSIQQSAKVNTRRDFRTTVDDLTDDALVNGYEQNVDLYGFLLDNPEARKQLMHAFVDDLYESLKNE